MRFFQYFLNLFTSKQTNTLQKQHAFHECGHALLAVLFEEDFTIEQITLYPQDKFPGMDTTDWMGGIHLKRTANHMANPSPEREEYAILIYLGGIVSQTIYRDGLLDFKKNLNSYLRNLSLLNHIGCAEDVSYVENNRTALSDANNILPNLYKAYLFFFTMKYLSDEEVWKAVVSLSQYLLNKNDLTLFTNEIREHLLSIGFYNYLSTNRKDIVEQCRKR